MEQFIDSQTQRWPLLLRDGEVAAEVHQRGLTNLAAGRSDCTRRCDALRSPVLERPVCVRRMNMMARRPQAANLNYGHYKQDSHPVVYKNQ